MTARGMGNETQHLPLSPQLHPPLTENHEPSHTKNTHAPSSLLRTGLLTQHTHKECSVKQHFLTFPHPPAFY